MEYVCVKTIQESGVSGEDRAAAPTQTVTGEDTRSDSALDDAGFGVADRSGVSVELGQSLRCPTCGCTIHNGVHGFNSATHLRGRIVKDGDVVIHHPDNARPT